MSKFCMLVLVLLSGEIFGQNTSCIPVVTISSSPNNICIGTVVTFNAKVANDGTGGLYKWKKNNVNVSVDNNYKSAEFHEGDIVICEYSCKTICGIDTTVVSSPVTMHVLNDISPVITVANNDSLICEGETTTFTSKSSYGNAVPSYKWSVNGSPVGANSPDYSTDSLTNGARVACMLTVSVPSCPDTTMSASSEMTIYVYPMIHPAITITANKTRICRGEEVMFTAKANGGAAPSFVWEVNGKPTGDVGPGLTKSTFKNGDSVSCTITIDQDSRCHTSTSAPSNKVVIQVQDFQDPTIMIEAPILEVCAGTAVTFTSSEQNAGDYKLYQWQVNGKNAGSNSPTFVSSELASGDKISCTLSTNIPGCSITANVSSNIEIVTIRATPVITFSPPEVTVIAGESAKLNASVSGTTTSVAWQPTEALLTPQSLTTFTVPLAQDTVINLTVADANGCTANKEIVVKVLHKLNMPSAFTPNNDGKNDVFRISPGSSLSLHVFSVFDRWGNVVFRTKDITKGWDGTFHGQDLNTGAYVYLIKGIFHDQELTVKGTVTLLR